MAKSALAGVFREYALTHQRETGGTTTDPYGNPIPVTEDAELIVNLEASKSTQLIFAEGADPKLVRGKGSCVDPVTLPSGVGIGTEFDVTWAGVEGKLRIVQGSVDPLEVLDDVLGQEFAWEWRPA